MPALTSLVNPASAVITNSVEQPVPTTISDATAALEEVAYYLGKLVKMSESLAVVDTNQRQRVVVESATWSANLPVAIRDNSSALIFSPGTNATTVYAAVPDIWRTIEMARQNYQASIRSNLQFS